MSRAHEETLDCASTRRNRSSFERPPIVSVICRMSFSGQGFSLRRNRLKAENHIAPSEPANFSAKSLSGPAMSARALLPSTSLDMVSLPFSRLSRHTTPHHAGFGEPFVTAQELHLYNIILKL